MRHTDDIRMYIGRDELLDQLRMYTKRIFAEEPCRVIYLEGAGGLGKTHLLTLYPRILERDFDAPFQEFESIRISEVVDFYSYASRTAEAIERELIQGLAISSPNQWYRISPDQVTETFHAYHTAYEEFRSVSESGGNTQAQREKLREMFVSGWNTLAASNPLVIRFDTFEVLFDQRSHLEPEVQQRALFLASNSAQSLNQAQQWILSILPRLYRTLVLIAGRPSDDSNTLLEALQKEAHATSLPGIAIEPLQPLSELNSLTDIRTYLQHYDLETDDDEVRLVRRITAGSPLLLACYVEARTQPLIYQGATTDPFPQSRPEFEDWLIETILNPITLSTNLENSASLKHRTRVFALYFLSYARRGITHQQLIDLFNICGLTYDNDELRDLRTHAQVKCLGDLLLLHDQIFLLIDGSGKPDAHGLRTPTLEYLSRMSRERVYQLWTTTNRSTLFGAMSDSMYYDLVDHFGAGYLRYTIYIDWLLRYRFENEALALSETFWNHYASSIYSEKENSTKLTSGVSLNHILLDESIRLAKLYRGRDQD